MTDEAPQFSADDLALLPGSDENAGNNGDDASAQPKGDTEAKTPPAEEKPAKEPAKGQKKGTIATGAGDEEEEREPAKPYWPDNWREKLAERISSGDKKAYARELKRLERIADPAGVYGMYRELDNRLNGGGLLKVPGADAKPEDIEAFHKALGVPEKPEDYFKEIKLENGAVIGDADKPLVDAFAAAVHKSGATPQVMSAALNWYYTHQEQEAAAQDDADDTFSREARQVLKEEYGASFDRMRNSIGALFASAPGGTDITNESGLFSRLMGGRTSDGRVIGNDPDMVRFLVSMAHEINPAAAVVDDAAGDGAKSIDGRLDELKKMRREDSKKYWSNEIQAEEQKLIAAKQKIQARN
jgi:hypothetical protein